MTNIGGMAGQHYLNKAIENHYGDGPGQSVQDNTGHALAQAGSALGTSLIPGLPFGRSGLRYGLGYGAFAAADPLISRGIGAYADHEENKLNAAVPKGMDWQEAVAQDPSLQTRANEAGKRVFYADQAKDNFFGGASPQLMKQTGARAVAAGGGNLLESLGLKRVGPFVKSIAKLPEYFRPSFAPLSGESSTIFSGLAPSAGGLARGGAAAVTTWGANLANKAIGGIGAPEIRDENGESNYDADHPWWHDSLHAVRSVGAGVIGGAPAGPVGMIAGAIVNPLSELWGDSKDIFRLTRPSPAPSQAATDRVQDFYDQQDGLPKRPSHAEWQAEEQAKVRAQQSATNEAKKTEDNQRFIQSFMNYRTALGIGVGVPLAGLLLYKMFKARKKPVPAQPIPA